MEQGYVSIFDLVPNYREAVEKENQYRDADFLSDTSFISGIEVYKLTPRLMSILTLIKNPLVTGGEVKVTDIFVFLWIISKDFCKDEEKQQAFFDAIALKVVDNDEAINTLVAEVSDFLTKTFQDSVGGKSTKEVSYTSGIASIVDIFAHEYGWSEDKVFNMPFRRLWQYLRAITLRHDPKATFNNPSDKVKIDFMGSLNK